ncbi:MAG TPA: DUF418 domain-containing protein [Brevundimonas sp.]|jgi:uncharacterized protein|uniref:DUF418 domain-containing protein n=1 Tax=Brevundimonas sp. TaxID=1871086 RepID=UPI002DE6D05C|nr:DUF418 domain-containing protein [Brevundimonas sp.]
MTDSTLEPARLAPISETDRIRNLDMLRGWAVLGILAVNAVAFAWPSLLMMAQQPPPADASQADVIGRWVITTFFADKMRTLFTMLFGVSIFLVGGERSDLDRGSLLRRRLGWLLLIGALHGAVLWWGDILLLYAVSGFVFLMCRSWSARRLLWVGGTVTILWAVVATLGYWGMANLPPAIAAKMAGSMPSATPEAVQAVVDAWLAGGGASFVQNFTTWIGMAPFFIPFMLPVTVPLMMVGLGLFKSGFFSGKAPTGAYLTFIVLGGANLAVLAVLGWQKAMAGEGVDPTGGLADAARGAAPLITLFYASLLILLARSALKAATAIFVPVGRMAFTNYLSQTLIMMSLYYAPWGPQWFGQHSTSQMWMVVGAIWIAQIVWSPLWLKAFSMGPLEWLWRCLTYGRMLPLRRAV